MSLRTLAPLFTLLLFTAGLAHADIAPPPGYKESCQVKKVRQPGEECVSCGDAYHGDVEACKRKLEPEGYAYRCQTRGASTWDEVWCRPAAAEEEPTTAEEEPTTAEDEPTTAGPADEESVPAGGCSLGAAAVGSPVLTLLLGCLLARRRR